MQVKWGKMATKLAVWLTAEVLLNLVGLDNLADYSEFIDGNHAVIVNSDRFTHAIATAQLPPAIS